MIEKKALIVAASNWNKNYIEKISAQYGYIVAVDRGAEAFVGAKRVCDILIGDFDSIDREKLNYFSTVKKLEFDVLKDKSDLELASEHVLDKGFKEIHFSGVLGGRVSHEIINIDLIASLVENYKIRAVVREKNTRIEFLNGKTYLKIPKGLQVSFIPMHDKKSSICLRGFQWNLSNHLLEKGSSLTLSNVTIEEAYIKHDGACTMVVIEPLDK